MKSICMQIFCHVLVRKELVVSRVREQLVKDQTDPPLPECWQTWMMVNGKLPKLNCLNLAAERIGKTIFCGLLIVFSVSGNFFIATVVYKTRAMRKPHQLFRGKHGHVGSSESVFAFWSQFFLLLIRYRSSSRTSHSTNCLYET